MADMKRAAVAARFVSMEDARRAIQALENAGVDGDDIELGGAKADTARRPTDPAAADRRAGRYLVPRLVLGVLVGAMAGAAVGVLAGLLLAAVTDVESGAVVACALAGVALGGVLGAFLSMERSVGHSEDWSLTFEDTDAGPLWVTVSTRDPAVADKARSTLEQSEPAELRSDA